MIRFVCNSIEQICIIFEFFDLDKNGLLEKSDCVRILKMAGKTRQSVDSIARSLPTPLSLKQLELHWTLFDIDATDFLHYILTRIQVESAPLVSLIL